MPWAGLDLSSLPVLREKHFVLLGTTLGPSSEPDGYMSCSPGTGNKTGSADLHGKNVLVLKH